MADKKPDISDMFVQTNKPIQPAVEPNPDLEPDEIRIPAEGRTVATGVGLKESELELLDHIAGDLDVSRNGLARYAIRHFLKAYLAGDIHLEFEKQYSKRRKNKQLRMD